MNLMNSPCTRRIISFNVSELLSNKFSFQWQNAIADVSVIVQPHHVSAPQKDTNMAFPYKALYVWLRHLFICQSSII